eukprot:jgi/Botrbrau1/16431/Bobra.0142s0030.1
MSFEVASLPYGKTTTPYRVRPLPSTLKANWPLKRRFNLITAECSSSMSGVIAVTGATGFVATELINQLLQKGYNIRATVRSLKDKSKYQYLEKLATSLPGSLELVQADLLQEGSFDAAVSGAEFVFHVASPFFIDTPTPQADLIDPAVKGTENLLSSVAKVKDSVKKVILTSSVAAVHGEYAAPPLNGHLYTEEDWNETSSIENGQAYHVSKTLAEKEAWKIAKEQGINLVTICPNFILGPVISDRVGGTSVGYMKGLLEGAPASGAPVICDVRDVARAHILAMEKASSSGRYIISNRAAVTPDFVVGTLRERFPDYSFPDPKEHIDAVDKLSSAKAEAELGLSLTPAKATLVDMATTLLALGVAKPVLKESASKQPKVAP